MKEVASAALTNAPTVDCSAVPASMEEMVQPAIDLYDKLIEINLEDAQFDIKKMYEEAQKVGLDIGDLQEYGFDYEQKEFGYESYQDRVKAVENVLTGLTKVVKNKVSDDWEKAQCNPLVRKHVTPVVQWLQLYFPVWYILGWWTFPITCVLSPLLVCTFPCAICCVAENLCLLTITIPLVTIFFCTLPCTTTFAAILQLI